MITSLVVQQLMSTKHNVNHTPVFSTSEGQGSNPNMSCTHCTKKTAEVPESPAYTMDAKVPWQPCSVPPVVLGETAPQTVPLPSGTVCGERHAHDLGRHPVEASHELPDRIVLYL